MARMAKLPHFGSVQDQVRIRGFSPQVWALANQVDVRDVVSALRFDHLDPAGREITDIGKREDKNPKITVRLDRQANTSTGAANLQIQVNDVPLDKIHVKKGDGTSIAQVIVPAAIHRAAIDCPDPSNARAHLENVVRSALLSSYNSMGSQYTIVEA
jgi:hypothetical protein